MIVQIALLLTVAMVLMRPWWLVTHRRCGLCRSFTSRRRDRCRFCGAHAAIVTDETAPTAGRSIDELGRSPTTDAAPPAEGPAGFGSIDVPVVEA